MDIVAEKIRVAVLGATGVVGQRFVQLLDGHPWFRVCALTGSELKIGMAYRDACHWVLPEAMPDWAGELRLIPSTSKDFPAGVAFSALPATSAHQVEALLAESGVVVCSNSSAFRTGPDVPLLLPEVNPDHTGLIPFQRRNRRWKGFIVTNPNCASTGMTIVLKSLMNKFDVRRVFAVSMQAVSGAGYPGVASLDIQDNVIPFIDGEEEKVEWEPRKMLGIHKGETIKLADVFLSVHTNRVPVSEGHMVCMSVELAGKANIEAVDDAIRHYKAPSISSELPSAPKPVIEVRSEVDRPQPRLDRMVGRGMSTVVGRLRSDPLFTCRMVVLSHNTVRGAAGGSIYNAELLVQQGYLH